MPIASQNLKTMAQKAIEEMKKTGEREVSVPDAEGFIVVRNNDLHKNSNGLLPLENISVGEEIFTICQDRRK